MKVQDFSRPAAKPELLAPGGSLEKCQVALLYGADAVYVGGKDYSLRAYAKNLNREELAMACAMAHKMGKRLYVTVNVFARENDLRTLPDYIRYLGHLQVDGVIVSDPGVLELARKEAPQVSIHLSTQANITNSHSARFWQSQGVSRINLARELAFDELSEIRRNCRVALEVFVHGAMCVSYSGRCLLSALLNDRSANHGLCSQPCRWSYRLVEEKRPGEYFPIHEDDRGAYIFNSKDLCLLEEVGKLTELGIDAFKIEGRMKGALYLATTVRTYRAALDQCSGKSGAFEIAKQWSDDLHSVSHRPYTKGFLFQDSGPLSRQVAPSTRYLQTHTLAGIVRPSPHTRWEFPVSPLQQNTEGWACIEVRSRLRCGMTLDFLHPDGTTHFHHLQHFEDLNGNTLQVAHPNTWIRIPVSFATFPLQVIRVST